MPSNEASRREREPLIGPPTPETLSASATVSEVEAQASDAQTTGDGLNNSAAGSDAAADPSSLQLFAALSGIYLGAFTYAIDGTLLATLSVPIASGFGDLPLLGWIASAFFIASAASQPVAGKLSDIYGRRTSILVASSVFALGNAICGLAPNTAVLLAGRVIAGLGGGATLPLGSVVISDRVPLRRRGIWQGVGNVGFGVGSGIGGPVGGWLHDSIGWRWAFALQIPLSLASMALIAWKVDEGKAVAESTLGANSGPQAANDEINSDNVQGNKAPQPSRFRRIDFLSASLLVTSVTLLLLGLTAGGNLLPWTHPLIIASLPTAIAALAAFVFVELRHAAEPVLPLRILGQRTVVAACLANWFTPMTRFGLLFHVPLYFQVQGYSAGATGLRLVPEAFATAIASLGCGLIMRRTGRYYALAIGAQSLVPLGLALLSTLTLASPPWPPFLYLFLGGLGYSGMLTTTLIALLAAVDPADIAAATSASYIFRSTGSVIGISAASAVFQNTLRPKLREQLRDVDGGGELMKAIESQLSTIFDLPSPLRENIQQAYMSALRAVFLTLLGFGGAGLVAIAFMREHPLPSKLAPRRPR